MITVQEKLEEAFQTANYMATLSNQRRIIFEELNQKLVYYINGGTFKIDLELINFTKTVLELGQDTDVVFLDENNVPIIVENVKDFLNEMVTIYFESVNDYCTKYNAIKSKRTTMALAEL